MPEFSFHIPLDVPFADISPLVKGFFPFTEAQIHLDPSFFKVKGQGNEGIALFIHPAAYTLDFLFMEEESFFTERVKVKKR
jgi:hypothetical protein